MKVPYVTCTVNVLCQHRVPMELGPCSNICCKHCHILYYYGDYCQDCPEIRDLLMQDRLAHSNQWSIAKLGQCYDHVQLWVLSGHSGRIAALQLNSSHSPLTPVTLMQIHQQFDVCLKCLGQNMSGVTDPCLKSGMFLSGSGIFDWHLSGHRQFSPHQTVEILPRHISQVLPCWR